MKGFALAILAAATYLILISIIYRKFDVQRRAALMMTLFALSVVAFAAVYLFSPRAAFLGDCLDPVCDWTSFGFGLFVYFSGFFGGILQLYNLSERGFSLRMLIDLDAAPGRSLTVDGLMAAYSGGQGISWMHDKRVAGLLQSRLVEIDRGIIRLTRQGRILGRIFDLLQMFLRVTPDHVHDIFECS